MLYNNQTNALNKQISDLKANESKYSDYEQIKSQLDAINKEKMTEQERIAKDKEETEKNLRESLIKNKENNAILAVYRKLLILEKMKASSLAQLLVDKFKSVV